MTAADSLERFRALLTLRTGLFFDETRYPHLHQVLERRLAAFAGDTGRYFAELEDRNKVAEVLVLAEELTVGETYFFRHVEQLRAYAEVALPERVVARSGSRPLKVLSAGSSSGEEAYSLAIFARERGLEGGRDLDVQGIDLNPRAIERAQRGRYTAWSLRETPDAVKLRWFRRLAREYEVLPSVKDSVQFRQGNLATLELPEADFDVIFCRNVVMYFSAEWMRQVIARLTHGLAPGGYLFLGHAETLRGLSLDYHLCHTHQTFYYRKKFANESVSRALLAQAAAHTEAPPALLPDSVQSAGAWAPSRWLESVQRSADRIQALVETPASSTPPPLDASPRRQHGRALELLGRERFSDALSELGEPSVDEQRDADTLLLRAVLQTHSGQLDRAEATCRRLLELDEYSAGAHYLLALCHERKGLLAAALGHDQTAIYLDPTLAMPRLHLGLLARRAGDRQTARRELTQAALLLEREDASRLLMYGGGFGRQGLISLCRSELDRLGDRA